LLERERERAFVVVDMQPYFVHELDPIERACMILGQQEVIDYCAHAGVPVAVLEFRGQDNTISEIKEHIKHVANVHYVTKQNANGFVETDLAEWLANHARKEVYVMGVNTSACVKATAEGALNTGFRIASASTLIADVYGYPYTGITHRWFTNNGIFFE